MFTYYLSTKTKDTLKLRSKLQELYGIFFLDIIFNSPMRQNLIAKGAFAAKLCYGLGEGSERIELLTLDTISEKEIDNILKKILHKFENVSLAKKTILRYSDQYIFDIKEGNQINTKLILEISKIKSSWKRAVNYTIGVMKSKDWALSTIIQVALLSQLEKDNPNIKS